MTRSSMLFGVGLGLLLGVGTNACSNEPAENTEACGMIIDACHPKDDGSDPVINGCHSDAHDGNDGACTTNLQMCLDVCNAAPDVGTGDHGSGDHDSGEESGHGHDGSGTGDHGSTGHGGSTGVGSSTGVGGSTSTDGSTGADDSSQASCQELGSTCHDVADEIGMMCHDIGHDGDEAACAKAWVECIEHCTA